MVWSEIKDVGGVISRVWKYFADKPEVKIVGVSPDGNIDRALYLHTNGDGSGVLGFSLMVESEKLVRIKSISVDYSSPLQLFDLGRRGFFESVGNNHRTYPFRMIWSGGADVRQKQVHAFAVEAQLPVGVGPIPVRLVVVSQVVHEKLGGYLEPGRLHQTIEELVVNRVPAPAPLFCAPPGYGFTTPQPYLIESGINLASSDPERVEIHERFSDGSSSSRTGSP